MNNKQKQSFRVNFLHQHICKCFLLLDLNPDILFKLENCDILHNFYIYMTELYDVKILNLLFDLKYCDAFKKLNNCGMSIFSRFNNSSDPQFVTNNFCVCCLNNYENFCDNEILKIIYDCETKNKNKYFEKLKYYLKNCDQDENLIKDSIRIFYEFELKNNLLIYEKFVEWKKSKIENGQMSVYSKNNFTSKKQNITDFVVKKISETNNQSVKNFLLKLQIYFTDVLFDYEICFKNCDISFEIIYEIINDIYKLNGIKNIDSDIKVNDYIDFLIETINKLDFEAYLYQPGLKFLIQTIILNNKNLQKIICTKKIFFNVSFCLLMNFVIKNKLENLMTYKRYASKYTHSDLKYYVMNYRKNDNTFSKILSYCICDLIPSSNFNIFLSQNILLDIEIILILNQKQNKTFDIIKKFYQTINIYKFVAKFIFSDICELYKFLFDEEPQELDKDLSEFYEIYNYQRNFFETFLGNKKLFKTYEYYELYFSSIKNYKDQFAKNTFNKDINDICDNDFDFFTFGFFLKTILFQITFAKLYWLINKNKLYTKFCITFKVT